MEDRLYKIQENVTLGWVDIEELDCQEMSVKQDF